MTTPCRNCGAALEFTFVDLGAAPPCEAFLTADQAEQGEKYYPLHARVCSECLLVQIPEYLRADEIFTDQYPYFSSYSTSWVEHARTYASAVIDRLGLGSASKVIEVASNDGYLLRHFAAAGIPVLGIEPTANTAKVAQLAGIETEVVFLGVESGRRVVSSHGLADLVVGNNVYAHVPNLLDFTRGLAEILAPRGMLTLEFPHVLKLIEQSQFDTIYHEHFQYYTLLTAGRALARADLTVVDVDELPSHGGSLRVYAQHSGAVREVSPAVATLLERERRVGLHDLSGYAGFAAQVQQVKRDLLEFLLSAQREGRTVVGYGAPGKGNTMLNYCGIRSDLVPFTVDRNDHKHGMYLPGSRIPVLHPDEIERARPDYVLVLPWNLRKEITEQLGYVRSWGGRLVFAIPTLEIA